MEFTEITAVEGMEFQASAAILVHELPKRSEKDGDFVGLSSTPEFPPNFVTMHRIRNGQLCEGFPITRRKLFALCKRLLPSLGKDLEYVPDNVIAYTPYNVTLLWWLPAGVRHLYFDTSTHIKSGKAPVPPLLLRYNQIGLTVFALKDNRRPTPETEIWQSPFFNFGCMGNVKLPKKPGLSDLGKLEDLFFRSAFTFHNDPKLKGTTGGALWKSLVGSGKTEFPYECLIKAGTLRTLLKGGARDY
jgi:PRTRC genetic system protein B